jgi:glycerophosphoryl diester phosphodiesterase
MDTVKIDSKIAKMVAHRGLSGIERENTCPAFLAAANRSYFGIETDVHITADGELVVIHDETLTRVTDGACEINVENCDYGDFKDVVLPDRDGSYARQDIRVPRLLEYIKICKKYDKVCVLELKNRFKREDIIRIIEQYRALEYLDKVIFISFSYENCVVLRELLPEAKIQYLTTAEVNDELINKLLEYKLDLDIHFGKLNPEAVEMLHSNGIEINCWTVDKKETAEGLAAMGVDFITSNILE